MLIWRFGSDKTYCVAKNSPNTYIRVYIELVIESSVLIRRKNSLSSCEKVLARITSFGTDDPREVIVKIAPLLYFYKKRRTPRISAMIFFCFRQCDARFTVNQREFKKYRPNIHEYCPNIQETLGKYWRKNTWYMGIIDPFIHFICNRVVYYQLKCTIFFCN